MLQLADALYQFDEAEQAFHAGMSVATDDRQRGFLFLNFAATLVNQGLWERAEKVARKALSYQPDKAKAKANLGLALLAQGQWEEGWPLYDAVIGFDQSRRKMQYLDEGEWDGKPNQTVVVYEEQGIGDAISFSSMLTDAMQGCKVILECDYKLEGLFRRSFPGVTVYGTRWDKAAGWMADHEIDASVSIGALGKRCRPNPQSCPGTPHLIADERRVARWEGRFNTLGKPVIGVAWSGGLFWTGDRYRRVTLEQLLPLFSSVDAVWVSLQYKDAADEIAAFREKVNVDLRQYPDGTLTKDYDDTAAMISAMDCIVSVPQSVVHLAGSLGVPCIAMKAPISCWKFASGMPFHRTNMTLVEHDVTWDRTIAKAAEILKERFAC